MSAHRFFLTAPLPAGSQIALPLSASDLHHAVGALRLRVGEDIEVVEPSGAVTRVQVTDTTRAGVFATRVAAVSGSLLPDVTLFQGVAKGEKMDEIVRAAVEIGVQAVVPVLTRRCVVQLDAARGAGKGERWRRVAASAAKQAKRDSIPHVADPVSFAEACSAVRAFDTAVVLWEECEGPGLAGVVRAAACASAARIALVVGPEGGLAADEVAALEAAGAATASLGPTILRAETAALVAVALAFEAMGGLGGSSG